MLHPGRDLSVGAAVVAATESARVKGGVAVAPAEGSAVSARAARFVTCVSHGIVRSGERAGGHLGPANAIASARGSPSAVSRAPDAGCEEAETDHRGQDDQKNRRHRHNDSFGLHRESPRHLQPTMRMLGTNGFTRIHLRKGLLKAPILLRADTLVPRPHFQDRRGRTANRAIHAKIDVRSQGPRTT